MKSLPVAFIHGFTGAPESWSRTRAFFEPALAIYLAIPGHAGRPLHPSSGFVDVADELWADLPRAPVHLVGYSLGARLALAIALRHPKSVARLTLIGVNPGLQSEAARAARIEADGRWAERLRVHGLVSFVDAWSALPLFATQASLPDEVRRAQRLVRLAQDPAALAQTLEQLGLGVMPSYWDALADFDRPLNVVVGERDEKFCAIADALEVVCPAMRRTTVARVGHNVPLEAPRALGRLLAAE